MSDTERAPTPPADARLAEIRERAEKATPGPWGLILHGNERYPFPLSVHTENQECWIARDGTVSSLANAEFIAHAREDVPFLLNEIDTYSAYVRELELERDRYAARVCELGAYAEAAFRASMSASEAEQLSAARVAALEEALAWPETKDIVLPRDEQGREPDPLALVLGLAAEPWKLDGLARLLRDSGEVNIPHRAEAEIAAALHWIGGIVFRCGKTWGDEYDRRHKDLKARAYAALQPEEEGR